MTAMGPSLKADAIAAHLPHGRRESIAAANHSWEPGVMAGRISAFLNEVKDANCGTE
ncbi:hypothetical protein [Arthrobacter sp. GMC3]|uniref:hypothetical protein n=1 Tax=Arthrobacter sp. GMC3 TaxID=2058894 RepID=UPI0015E39FB4|nr:hypothetical protein [Arthrobacter sp. GMC3]